MISEKLLEKVLAIQTTNSTKQGDAKIIEYIKRFVNSNKLRYTEDKYGNIYVEKGNSSTYPCIVSHVDTVHSLESAFMIKKVGYKWYAFNPNTMRQAGIGGDDKVGVFMCLSLLKDCENIKVVFYRDEEGGCKGSTQSILHNKEWYKDCSFLLACDRRGRSDLILDTAGCSNLMVSDEFQNDFDHIFEKYNFTKGSGTVSDATNMFEKGINISCLNVSVGYYNPHTSYEYIDTRDINNTYKMLLDMVEITKKKYPNTPIHKTSYSTYNPNYSKNFSPNFSFSAPSKKLPFDMICAKDLGVTFQRVTESSNFYRLSSNENIHLTGICPVCNKKDSLIIAKDLYTNTYVYCLNHLNTVHYSSNGYTPIIRDIAITWNKINLVWSNPFRMWLDKNHAVWCPINKEWKLK